MKKIKFFIVSAIAIAVLSVFTVSCCTKELDCQCYTYDDFSQSRLSSDLKTALKKVVKSGGDCSDVQSELLLNYGYNTMSCSSN